jgi:hypothetical protein
MKSAHVIYISPKMQTARNAWCLSNVAGGPAIRRLVNRLRKAFGECLLLCHEEATAQLICAASGGPVEVSSRPGRYSALADFVQRHNLDYVALYPDTSIFPDCEGVAEMLALHERTGASATRIHTNRSQPDSTRESGFLGQACVRGQRLYWKALAG